MKITTFNSESNTSKVPVSPFGDNTFEFVTTNVQTLEQAFRLMCTNFILNVPLVSNVRARRKKQDLQKYFSQNIDYIVLDIDKVKTLQDRNKILEYFRQYQCIIGESRSYNGIDNFNLKGLLACEEISVDKAKYGISQIHIDLKDLCDVDECVLRRPSLNAPIQKYSVLLNSTVSNKYSFEFAEIPHKKTENNLKLDEVKTLLGQDFSECKDIPDLCLSIFGNLGFKALKTSGEAIRFSHYSEKKTPGGYYWFRTSPYIMHHFNPARNVNIYEYTRKLPITKELLKSEMNLSEKLCQTHMNGKVLTVNERFLQVTPEINSSINTFLYGPPAVFEIRSPMGTGKSTIISKIIEKAHSQEMRVLIVTNRRSVANDFKQKYGIKIYNKDKYNVGDSLICQYDSLWKYNMRFFDLFILDEFMSLMLYSRSAPNNNVFNISRLFSTLNKKVVIADAFLTGYENNFISNTEKFVLLNEFRDKTELVNYSNFNNFVYCILEKARKFKITVSATSLNFIHGLTLLLKKYGVRTVTLTAETSENTKERIYEIFNQTENDKFDCLIYSPTLTVGVSNLNKVKYHFHYDTSTTDVISSLQMIKRTRNAEQIHLYIKDKTNFVKTTFDEIKDEYLANAVKHSDTNYLFELNDYGEIILSNIGKKGILIDVFKNILEYNHKNSFFFLSAYHFKNEVIQNYDIKESNILLPYIKQTKENAKRIQELYLDDFLALNEIDRNTDINYADLTTADEQIKSCQDVPGLTTEVRKSLILEYINDKSFFTKLRNYQYFYRYSNNELTENDIKTKITELITSQKNLELVEFLKELIKTKHELKCIYKPSEFNDNLFLKQIGYTAVNSNMMRMYILDPKVNRYFDYIKP